MNDYNPYEAPESSLEEKINFKESIKPLGRIINAGLKGGLAGYVITTLAIGLNEELADKINPDNLNDLKMLGYSVFYGIQVGALIFSTSQLIKEIKQLYRK